MTHNMNDHWPGRPGRRAAAPAESHHHSTDTLPGNAVTTAVSEHVLSLSDANAVEALIHFTSNTPGGEVECGPGYVLATGGSAYAGSFHNAAARSDRGADPDLVIHSALRFFGARCRPFSLWIGDHVDGDLARAAERIGLEQRVHGPGAAGMALARPLDVADLPGVVVRQVAHAAMVKEFGDVVAEAFAHRAEGPQPRDATLRMFASDASLLDRRVIAVIAYKSERPVACGMSFLSAGAAGLYWMATVPAARGRGLGELLTRTITSLSFARGARLIVLQASTMGEPIYQRLGFREVTRYRRYIGRPAGDHIGA